LFHINRPREPPLGPPPVNRKWRKRVPIVLLAVALLSLTPLIAKGDTVDTGYCIAIAEDEGALSVSRSEVYVYGDRTGDYIGAVSDKYIDDRYIAARFVLIVDGVKVVDEIYGVPDGGTREKSYSASYVGSYAEGVTTDYYGSKDSRATATAYWSEFCPA